MYMTVTLTRRMRPFSAARGAAPTAGGAHHSAADSRVCARYEALVKIKQFDLTRVEYPPVFRSQTSNAAFLNHPFTLYHRLYFDNSLLGRLSQR